MGHKTVAPRRVFEPTPVIVREAAPAAASLVLDKFRRRRRAKQFVCGPITGVVRDILNAINLPPRGFSRSVAEDRNTNSLKTKRPPHCGAFSVNSFSDAFLSKHGKISLGVPMGLGAVSRHCDNLKFGVSFNELGEASAEFSSFRRKVIHAIAVVV